MNLKAMEHNQFHGKVIVLFKELMQMVEDGVFVNNLSFGVGQPKTWLNRVKELNKQSTNLSFADKMISLPYGLESPSLILPSELETFVNLIVSRDIEKFDELAAKFWLFVILSENPELKKSLWIFNGSWGTGEESYPQLLVHQYQKTDGPALRILGNPWNQRCDLSHAPRGSLLARAGCLSAQPESERGVRHGDDRAGYRRPLEFGSREARHGCLRPRLEIDGAGRRSLVD